MFRATSNFLIALLFLFSGTAGLLGEISVTTTSSKGWTRTTALNSLGLPTGNTLSGTGIPTTGLTPVWRADGSLESVELTIGGEAHSAAFHPDGRLSSLTAPGRGNILGGHTIADGIETLSVDGVVTTRKLDGTEKSVSGSNVIGKTEVLATSGGSYKKTPRQQNLCEQGGLGRSPRL